MAKRLAADFPERIRALEAIGSFSLFCATSSFRWLNVASVFSVVILLFSRLQASLRKTRIARIDGWGSLMARLLPQLSLLLLLFRRFGSPVKALSISLLVPYIIEEFALLSPFRFSQICDIKLRVLDNGDA